MSRSTVAAVGALGVLVFSVSIAHASSDKVLARGHYLAAIAGCAGCHTAKTPDASLFAGGVAFGSGPAARFSPNLTPDRATGIGAWSKAQIVDALRKGVRPDGSRLGPPMPQHAYRGLTEEDAAAIADYLQSLPAVHHFVARSEAGSKPNKETSSAEPPMPILTTSSPEGRYLFASVTHCRECHAVDEHSAPKAFKVGDHLVVAPSLTADLVSRYSDSDLSRLLQTGVRPDGSRLVGPMPVAAYSHLTNDDLHVLITYLRGKG